MKNYKLVIDEPTMKQIKVWAAQLGLSIKNFLLQGAKEKAEREGLK